MYESVKQPTAVPMEGAHCKDYIKSPQNIRNAARKLHIVCMIFAHTWKEVQMNNANLNPHRFERTIE